MTWTIFVLILGIIFFSAFVKSAFGFGDGMTNMALITQVAGLQIAAPLVILLTASASTVILLRDWKVVDWRNVLPLAVSAILFAPLGVQLLDWTDPSIMRKVLGGFILLFGVYSLLKPPLGRLKSGWWSTLFGGLGGITAGAYSIAGPPAVIYATLRKWNPTAFRASIQGYFVPLAGTVVATRLFEGDYTANIWTILLSAAPILVLGITFGRWFNQQIENPAQFNRYIYGLLIILGTLLMVN